MARDHAVALPLNPIGLNTQQSCDFFKVYVVATQIERHGIEMFVRLLSRPIFRKGQIGTTIMECAHEFSHVISFKMLQRYIDEFSCALGIASINRYPSERSRCSKDLARLRYL